jgi:hypothetical protein
MVTYNNYAETVEKFGYQNLNKSLQQDYDVLKDATSDFSNWNLYHEDKESKHIMDAAFNALSQFMIDKGKSVKKEGHSGKGKNSRKEKSTAKEKSFGKKKGHFKPEGEPVHFVEHIDEQVKFIRRFVGLHNREKPFNAFLNLLKAIQKAIIQRIVRKTSTYAKQIESIQETLVKICNTGKEAILLQINEPDLPTYVAIAGGEKVYPSIGFIKRYIGMEGKAVEKEKRLTFIKQIDTAIKKGKLDADPYLDKVKSIASELKKIKSNSTAIKIANAELNGLKGITRRCGCYNLGRIYNTRGKKLRQCCKKTYTDSKRQGACSHNRGLAGIMSAEEVLNQHYEMLSFKGIWKRLFGEPAKNFTMLIHGGPGAGKTTFMMLFVKFLSTLGSVLYISSEEYGASTLTKKISKYLTPTPANVFFTADKTKIEQGDYGFVVLDSATNIGMDIEEFKKLKEVHPDTAFIVLLQHTKNGQFRGSKEWEHETEIAAGVTEGTIRVYRNRYGVMGEWFFFDEAGQDDPEDEDSEQENEDEDYQYRF